MSKITRDATIEELDCGHIIHPPTIPIRGTEPPCPRCAEISLAVKAETERCIEMIEIGRQATIMAGGLKNGAERAFEIAIKALEDGDRGKHT